MLLLVFCVKDICGSEVNDEVIVMVIRVFLNVCCMCVFYCVLIDVIV